MNSPRKSSYVLEEREEEFELEAPLNHSEAKGVLEQLKCPICVSIPKGKIFQCCNGHTICDTCKDKVRKCPQCRVSFEGEGKLVRVRVLESVLELVKMPCPYKEKGCGELVTRKEFQDHTNNCIYSGKCVQLCRKLGYDCDHWTSTLNAESAVDHFKSTHNLVYIKGSVGALRYKDFTAVMESLDNCDGTWTPVVFQVNHSLFLLLTLFNAQDNSVSWTCLNLKDTLDPGWTSTGPEVEFRIENHCDKLLPIKWKVSPGSLLQLQNCDLKDFVLQRYPIPGLQERYVQPSTGVLTLHVSFTVPGHARKLGGITPMVKSIKECLPRVSRTGSEFTLSQLPGYQWLAVVQQRCVSYVDNFHNFLQTFASSEEN